MRTTTLTTLLRTSAQRPAIAARTFTSTLPRSSDTPSALDELSSSIEKLARARASASSSSPLTANGAVHNPRSTNPTRERQTVSGRAFMNGHYYNPSTLAYDSITQRPNRLARPLLGPTKAEAVQQDLIHINGLKPGKPSLNDDSYKNAAILANYVTEMGKIMPRASTGLTRKSQRAVGKAVRRARSMGLLPVMSRGGTRASGAGWK
ncbi:related to 30s ribosomal protein s18 [Sporisorium reilianum SRZ2]|uniref:Small ribosomal subunit protein bS18m n=2 Tax=Sporisorium reilianum TaxID=72558 RepID=E6ZX37_SPORE|nr:related to 30s ribosomal protein s18 [Sporisorium reilianum SRZ2]SJX61666.1 related to 30s ribosomal protein s18 [Sporisorium reilianum f. sp. reilianum]